MTALDTFLEAAWAAHGEEPQQVADELAASSHLVESVDHVPRYAAIVTHVFGEHLGDWARGIALLEALGALPAAAGTERAARSVARNVAVLRHAAGEEAALAPLGPEDKVSALATAASIFTARRQWPRALQAYDEALRLAEPGLPEGSTAPRALAVGGNNLAAALEEKSDRNAQETAGMVRAAEGGLKYWKVAGTWLEEERAEYRLARSLIQAADAARALQCAQSCVAICEHNEAPPIERFFGHAVLALAQRASGDMTGFAASRASAQQCFEQVAADERSWCEGELRELAS